MTSKKNPIPVTAPRIEEKDPSALPAQRGQDADSLEGAQAKDERSPLRPEPPVRSYPNTKGRQPLPSTTREDIERADGEGMAPVPPPRPHTPKPHEEKASNGY